MVPEMSTSSSVSDGAAPGITVICGGIVPDKPAMLAKRSFDTFLNACGGIVPVQPIFSRSSVGSNPSN
jgi:hypothetical protein